MASLNHRKYFHPPSNAFPTAILVRDYKKSDRKLFNAVRSAVNARNNKVVVATFISRYSCNPFEKPKVDGNGQSAAKQTLRGSLLHFSYGKSCHGHDNVSKICIFAREFHDLAARIWNAACSRRYPGSKSGFAGSSGSRLLEQRPSP